MKKLYSPFEKELGEFKKINNELLVLNLSDLPITHLYNLLSNLTTPVFTNVCTDIIEIS